MKRLLLVLLSSLALGGVALAEDKAKSSGSEMQKSDKMKGPPNADGAQQKSGEADRTGTGSGGAAAAKATGEAEGKK